MRKICKILLRKILDRRKCTMCWRRPFGPWFLAKCVLTWGSDTAKFCCAKFVFIRILPNLVQGVWGKFCTVCKIFRSKNFYEILDLSLKVEVEKIGQGSAVSAAGYLAPAACRPLTGRKNLRFLLKMCREKVILGHTFGVMYGSSCVHFYTFEPKVLRTFIKVYTCIGKILHS